MSHRESNSQIPTDWLWHLGLLVMALGAVLLSSILLPVLDRLRSPDLEILYGCGVGAGALSVVFLFLARLPVYRQRRFWTVGPRELDRKHRCFYWLAYGLLTISLLALAIVWARMS